MHGSFEIGDERSYIDADTSLFSSVVVQAPRNRSEVLRWIEQETSFSLLDSVSRPRRQGRRAVPKAVSFEL